MDSYISPWQQADAAFGSFGGNFHNALLTVLNSQMQQRKMEENRALRNQEMWLKQQEMDLQREHYMRQGKMYDAQAQEAEARGMLDKAAVEAATNFANASRRSSEISNTPLEMSPTRESAFANAESRVNKEQAESDMLAAVAQIAALGKKPEEYSKFIAAQRENQNPSLVVPNNASVLNPRTGSWRVGPHELNQGQSLFAPKEGGGMESVASVTKPENPFDAVDRVNTFLSHVGQGTKLDQSDSAYAPYQAALGVMGKFLQNQGQGGLSLTNNPVGMVKRPLGTTITKNGKTYIWTQDQTGATGWAEKK